MFILLKKYKNPIQVIGSLSIQRGWIVRIIMKNRVEVYSGIKPTKPIRKL